MNRKVRQLRTAFALRVMPKLRMANYWLVARFALALIAVLRLLPPDAALAFMDRVARRFGPLFGRHRTALGNLRLAYPEKSEAEIETIALDMWGNMARLATEYIFLNRLFDYRPDDPGAGRIETVGEDYFRRIAAEPKPHIIFTAHLGNFELLPVAGAAHGIRITALFRPPNNPFIADYIFSTRRDMMGELLASNTGAGFGLSNVLERNGNIGLLVDQKFGDGIVTTFFGRKCQTNPILPMLARRFECDVYPTRCVRLPGGRYRLIIEEKLELARNARGDIDIRAASQQLNDVVERWVREDPGQWMWFHKRWDISGIKHFRRPGGKLGDDRAIGGED